MVVNYFNFVFHNDVKTKSMHKILNFLFQFIKKHEIAFLVQGFSLLACSFNDVSKLNFCNTIFMLQNYRWLDATYINNGYINVINSTKKRYRIKTLERAENTLFCKLVYNTS